NKQGTSVALPVNIVVGDNDVDTTDASPVRDQLIYRGTAGTNQVADGSSVSVGRSGSVDLSNRSDTIGLLTVDLGSVTGTAANLTVSQIGMTGGTIHTGTGTLTLTAAVANSGVNSASGATPTAQTITASLSSQQAVIGGNLNLNNAFRTVFTHD